MSETEEDLNRTTVSLPGELMEAGRKQAQKERRSFSAYVAVLVEADLERVEKERQAKEAVA